MTNRSAESTMKDVPAGATLPEDAEASKKAILRAATAVFAEVGFDSAHVGDIARRAAVSEQVVYGHFTDKEDLYRQVLQSRLVAPAFFAAEGAAPKAMLMDAIRWYFRLLAKDRAFARLLAWGMLTDRGGQAILLSTAAPAMELLANLVRRAIAAGAVRADVKPEGVRTAIISLCVGYVLQHDIMMASPRNERQGPWSEEAFVDAVCQTLFEGIAPRKVSR
jgi:AcrR family transcriptional regulator